MSRLLLLVLAVWIALTAPALAARSATPSEARAIRAAALASLSGQGWRVSAIRISTVTPTARYARAAVDNRRTGVGGEMLLARRAGHWRRVFLGTNDFCTAPLPRAALADLGFRCPVS